MIDVIIGESFAGNTPLTISMMASGVIGRYLMRLMRMRMNGTKLSKRKKQDWAAYPVRLSSLILLNTARSILFLFSNLLLSIVPSTYFINYIIFLTNIQRNNLQI